MFSHLHVHTEYSILDGMSKIEELILKAKEMGQRGIAITDHGSTSGLYEAYTLGKKHDFKVVLGSEFYLQTEDEKKNGHIVLLAKNNKGLENIYKLQAYAYTQNFYYKPRITMEQLQLYSEGLICLSACLANPICQAIISNKDIQAYSLIKSYQNIFGDDFYLEIQSNTLSEQRKVNERLQQFSKDFNIPTVITNDVHYTYKTDAYAHEVMLAMQQKRKMDDEKRWKFETNDFWLKSEAEVLKELSYLDSSIISQSLNNIDKIIDQCNASIEPGNHLPHYYEAKDEKEEKDMFAKKCAEMYEKRIFQTNKHNPEFYNDFIKECNVISDTGYAGYFLIVQDFVNEAKKNGILVGDGRGSGAGSKVAYALGITEVNPQPYGLLFERFLSPGRSPDFDIDFSDQEFVYKYLQSKYGENNVARVGAFGTLTAKACTRKVLGVFGFSQSSISKIIGLMPNRIHFTLQEAIDESKEFKEIVEKHEKIFNVIRRLEGKISHMSTHAGGVIICENLTHKLPIIRDSEEKDKIIVGYDKYVLEELGHYKFDILGLDSLSIIYYAKSFIKDKINIHDLYPYDDPKVYDMLCQGDVLGVFQLSDQKHSVLEQQPRNFNDLIAINALIRPGVGDWNEYIARRKGKKYDLHKARKPYLEETSGVITYQDQYLLDCKTFAGWDIAFSDKHVRKNKDIKSDTQLADKFVNDCLKNGYDKDTMLDLWMQICDIVDGGYGFNKAHSTSYAVLSYQTAWLKCYYPKEFYASLLTCKADKADAIIPIYNEMKQKGIKLLPPNINMTEEIFFPTKEGIIFRLSNIDHVGGSAIYAINQIKPITSLSDLIERRIPKFIKINALENLVKAGCFDFENPNRIEMYNKLYELLDKEPPTQYRNQAQMEKEAFGFYLSEHPLDKYTVNNTSDFQEGQVGVTIGEVIDISEVNDKNGKQMAFIKLSNQYEIVECIAFTSQWIDKNLKGNIQINDVILINGKKSKNKMLINNYELLERSEQN